ncbi:MAG TPA: ABC transporter permease [Chthoniobacterales bacterium]|jgi:putative ABC transport system permease protein|nr:ABC transporter permease [Chthoniobacterales bacterium]
MFTDLKYALRMLVKAPGFTIIAILTLALGIGANSAIFSVIDAVLLHPLPFPRPDQVVAVWSRVAHNKLEKETESIPDYVDLRDQSQTLSALAAFTRAGAVLNGTEEARQLYGVATTSDIFSVLGVAPARGRVYTREDDNVDARVVVLTDYAWKTYFNRDPEIVGKQVSLSWRLYTVLGVMPPGFQFPVEGERAEYLQPLHPLVPEAVNNRDSHFARMVGRLKPGVTVQQCDAEMKTIAARLEKQYPKSNTDRSESVYSLHDDIVGDVRPALITILAAVAFVLLIACANVANLLLARATARQREIAIRTALGASRTRMVGQLLGEGFLLSIFGAAGGLLIAWWGIDLLRVFGPQDVPRLGEVAINPPVFFFTFAVAIFSTLLFALVPALQMTRPNVNESLQEGNRGAVGPESHHLRRLLVIAQVALSLLLLAGAGLLIKSFANLRATKPGFDPQHAIVAELILPKAKYPEPEKHRQFFEQILPKLAALPGVEAVGAAFPMPFSNNDWGSTFSIVGQPPRPPGQELESSHLTVTQDYFRAMGTPLLRGRVFSSRDTKDSPPVVMVNDVFAQRFFPGGNAIGHQIVLIHGDNSQTSNQPSPPKEIVGIVGGSRHESLAIQPLPEFYIPASQDPSRRMDVVFRTAAIDPAGLQSPLRNIVHEFDKTLFIPTLEPLEKRIGITLAQPRFNMMLLGAFAGVAMILAAIGIYGVIAYTVVQRTREIGIRMALGAQKIDMLTMVMRQSFTVIGIGLLAGILGALAVTRLMSSLLYGVSSHDLSIYAIVTIILSAAALIATYFPARRAMAVDPMVALRYE